MSDEQQALKREAQAFYDAMFGDELRNLLDQADNGNMDAIQDIESRVSTQRQLRYYVTLAGAGYGSGARLVVEINDYDAIESAWFEYQGGLPSWTAAPLQDTELLKRLAERVCFYEE